MSEDTDYEEILSGTVDEAKKSIRDMENPDYEELLRLEKEGDDRKTLKEFLERQLDSEDIDESGDEEVEETVDTEENGFLTLSANQLLLLGGIAGVLIGLLVGYSMAPAAGTQGNPAQARQAVEELITSGSFNGTVDVGQPTERHGMYFFNVTMTQDTPNGTQTGYQATYVTKDSELLFPVMNNLFVQSPINIQQAIAKQRQRSQNQ